MAHQELNTRRDSIFRIIVNSYIDTAEPVGSRTISRLYEAGLSPASIRNVMADLEDAGLIAQPHTSAGRVPTDKGYRYYVDTLMEPEALAEDEKDFIRTEIHKARTLNALAERVSQIISELTANAAVLYLKKIRRLSMLSTLAAEIQEVERLLELIEGEPELFIDGASRMFEQPEFQDVARMRSILQAFDEKLGLIHILMQGLSQNEIHVHIGSENKTDKLDNVSVVVKDCYLGSETIGGVAVVGPTRMRYSKIVSLVDYVADNVSDVIKRF